MSAIRSAKRARIRSRSGFIAVALSALTAVSAGSLLAYRAYAAARDAALAPQITELTEARLTSVDNVSDGSDGTSSVSSTTVPAAIDSDSGDHFANNSVKPASTTSDRNFTATTAPELLADLGSGHNAPLGAPENTHTALPGTGFANGPITGPAPKGLGTISAPDVPLASNSPGGPQGSPPSYSFPGFPSFGTPGGADSPGSTPGGSGSPSPKSTTQNTPSTGSGGKSNNSTGTGKSNGGTSTGWQYTGTEVANASGGTGTSQSTGNGNTSTGWQYTGTEVANASGGAGTSQSTGNGNTSTGWQYTGTEVADTSAGNSSSGGSGDGSTPPGTFDDSLFMAPLIFGPMDFTSDPPQVAVPEPSSITLFGTGLVALMLLGATRRRTGIRS